MITRRTTQVPAIVADDDFFAAVQEASASLETPPAAAAQPPPLRRATKRVVAPTAVLGSPPVRRLVERTQPSVSGPNDEDPDRAARARKRTHQTMRGGPSPITPEEAATLRAATTLEAPAVPAEAPRREDDAPQPSAASASTSTSEDARRSASLVNIGAPDDGVSGLASEDLERSPNARGAAAVAASLAAAALLLVSAWAWSRSQEPLPAVSVAAAASVPVASVEWPAPLLSPVASAVTQAEPEAGTLAVSSSVVASEPDRAPTSSARRIRRRPAAGPAPAPEEESELVEEADPEPVPEPAPVIPSVTKPTASAALAEAKLAFRNGDYASAFRRAMEGKSLTRDQGAVDETELLHLVARAGCRIGRKDAALEALRALPLLQRGSVRRDCRREGERLGV